MKTRLSLILGGMFLLCHTAAMAQAASAPQTYTVSATVPAAAGVGITVNKVTGPATAPVFTLQAGNTLTYDALTFNAVNNIFLSDNYWAIDVANTGAGSPNATITYGTEAFPAGAVHHLGTNSAISFDKEVFTNSSTPPTQSAIGSTVTLSDPTITGGKNIPSASTAGGWLRIYMGLCTGAVASSSSGPADPAGCHPFSGADLPGAYTGQLTISATTS